MQQHDEDAKTIDYRSPATRVSDRTRTTRMNIVVLGGIVVVVVVLGIYLIGGF